MRSRKYKERRGTGIPGWLGILALAGLLSAGCGRAAEEGGRMGTGRTVRQAVFSATDGLGGYRSVAMPPKAKRNLVEAQPDSTGSASYLATVGD